ncbi:MAG: biotin carboxylase N-terminal domain-containing protein [Lysobacterales bacterium]
MIKRLLIANRGEIACRIIRTCRRLGIETVAVYSDADKTALHTRSADQAIYIGSAPPTESYLNIPKILDAVAATRCDAVHPGYGFLSENAEFVSALERADCTFVGPSANTISLMGSKADAKATMEAAGVPVVPGYHGADQSDEVLAEQAAKVGYPLMLKAAAGGGGKGMRIVRRPEHLSDALSSARRESEGAFGDSRMIIERYIETPRHLEVQIFGDGQGNVVHLFERDCSTQRRYQKVLEESPAPGITPEQRDALCAAGVSAAAAVNYRGAGTVEFIATADGEFFFMEMNTRLQVEHPVTEAVTGLDLVQWQLHVAAGLPLPLGQDEITASGHALEARLYAEDPQQGFLPSSGSLSWLAFPPFARVDSGVEQDDTVSVHYDPMVAKLICHAPTRREALAQMSQALAHTRIAGLKTNLAFLARLIKQPAFANGVMHTALLDEELPEPASEPLVQQHLAIAALALDQAQGERKTTALPCTDRFSPWAANSGWRLGEAALRTYHLQHAGGRSIARVRTLSDGVQVIVDERSTFQLSNIQQDRMTLSFEHNGQRDRAVVYHQRDEASESRSQAGLSEPASVHVASAGWITVVQPIAAERSTVTDAAVDGTVIAPMPGKIVALKVAAGQSVEEGQELIVMEAMKMELSLKAPASGVVKPLAVSVGAFVEADTCLLELELAAESGSDPNFSQDFASPSESENPTEP